jgi:hypothetical protein
LREEERVTVLTGHFMLQIQELFLSSESKLRIIVLDLQLTAFSMLRLEGLQVLYIVNMIAHPYPG